MGTCRQCALWSVTGHNNRKVIGQVSIAWALNYPETVHQRPCMMREIESWLSDSRVSNNSVVADARSKQMAASSFHSQCLQQSDDHVHSALRHWQTMQTPRRFRYINKTPHCFCHTGVTFRQSPVKTEESCCLIFAESKWQPRSCYRLI